MSTEKQKQQVRERVKRYRDRQKSVTDVTPPCNADVTLGQSDYGQADCQCGHCRNNRSTGSRYTLNHGPYKTAAELAKNEINRVALPGDMDYRGNYG
jgi:hypothetical protein